MCGAASGCSANERVPADRNVLAKDELVAPKNACEVADKTMIRTELAINAWARQVKNPRSEKKPPSKRRCWLNGKATVERKRIDVLTNICIHRTSTRPKPATRKTKATYAPC